MDSGEIERQNREMEQRTALNREYSLQEIERRTGADRALAEYLLLLEERLDKLERDK